MTHNAISSGHQRYPADTHGHSKTTAGLGANCLTCGGRRPKLHGMQGVRAWIGRQAHGRLLTPARGLFKESMGLIRVRRKGEGTARLDGALTEAEW
jgi:hypothetical protein